MFSPSPTLYLWEKPGIVAGGGGGAALLFFYVEIRVSFSLRVSFLLCSKQTLRARFVLFWLACFQWCCPPSDGSSVRKQGSAPLPSCDLVPLPLTFHRFHYCTLEMCCGFTSRAPYTILLFLKSFLNYYSTNSGILLFSICCSVFSQHSSTFFKIPYICILLSIPITPTNAPWTARSSDPWTSRANLYLRLP